MSKKRILSAIAAVLMLTLVFTACSTDKQENTNAAPAPETEKEIILSTTTSTQDSGLLDYLLPKFKEDTGIEVKVVAVGTGQALKMGEDGEADVLLVHAKASEEEFVKAGHGVARYDVMYNDFLLIGPKEDAKFAEAADKSILNALKYINDNKLKFISRGDDSGTHKAELKLWKELGVEPSGDWYVSAGKGMGPVIQMANEMKAYTISDRATYLSMKDKTELTIAIEKDSKLFNQYGVIAVNPDKNDKINKEGAQAFVDWILSEKTQKLIEQFGIEEYGQSLFVPNAVK